MARKTKQEALETRCSILDAAEQLFLSQGVSNTSLQDIAQAAQVTRGAIYWHFKDKAEVFNAMMERATMPLEEGMSLTVSAAAPAETAVPSLAELRWGLVNVFYSAVHNERTRRVFEIVSHKVEYTGEMQSLKARKLEAHQQWRQQNGACFERAIAEGLLPQGLDTQRAAITLMALVGGLIDEWVMAPDSFDLLDVGQSAIEGFLNSLSGSRQPLLPPLTAEELARLGQLPVCPLRTEAAAG